MIRHSEFAPVLIDVDDYSQHPPRDDLRQQLTAVAARGFDELAWGLFTSGALPHRTASGIAPDALAIVPWWARLPIATEPDRKRADAALERWTPHLGTHLGHLAEEARAEFADHPANVRHRKVLSTYAQVAERSAARHAAPTTPAEDAQLAVHGTTRSALEEFAAGVGLGLRDLLDP